MRLRLIAAATRAGLRINEIGALVKALEINNSRAVRGTCALRGCCDPKQMLFAGAETLDSVSRMRGRGVRAA